MPSAESPVGTVVEKSAAVPIGPMSRTFQARPALTRQVGWTLVGNLVYAAAQSIIVIILAKTLNPAIVGQFGLGVAIATPILMFTNLQLRALQATESSCRVRFSDHFALRSASTVAALIMITGTVLLVGYSAVTGLVILSVGVMKCVEALSDTVYGHLQRYERVDRIAISMIGKGLLSIVGLGAAIAFTRDVTWGALAVAATFAAVLVCYDLPGAHRVTVEDPKHSDEAANERTKDLVSTRLRAFQVLINMGLPLGVTSVLLAVAANIPRYLLERTVSETALGYFVALAYPSAVFVILLSAFGQAATPRMAEYHRTTRARFRRLVFKLMLIPPLSLFLVGGVAVLLGPDLLRMLYRADYAQYFPEFLILLVAGAVWGVASVLGYAATSSRRLSSQAPAAAIICTMTIVCGFLIVPKFGITGAAIVSMISGVCGIAVYGFVLLGKPDVSDYGVPIMEPPAPEDAASGS